MKRIMRHSLFFVSTCLALIILSPIALGLTRKINVTNFVDATEITTGGFQASALADSSDAGSPDVRSTSQAIQIRLLFGSASTDFDTHAIWIATLDSATDGGIRRSATSTSETMANMYYALWALSSAGKISSLDSSSRTRTWITNRNNSIVNPISWGFSETINGTASLVTTFYAIESLYYLGATDYLLANGSQIRAYITNCRNLDGSYADIPGSESTLAATWAAVSALSRLSSILSFTLSTEVNVNNVLTFVSQYYFGNAADTFNYGGYGVSTRATVYDTFYARSIYSLLGSSNANDANIQAYLLGCQNAYDGGFGEKLTETTTPQKSSLLTTFFALNVLVDVDSTLAMLNSEIWFLPFDYIPLIVLAVIIGVVIVVAVIYKRKHRD